MQAGRLQTVWAGRVGTPGSASFPGGFRRGAWFRRTIRADVGGLAVARTVGDGIASAAVTKTEMIAARRPAYISDLAEGTDRFFEARRESCPWCASTEPFTVVLRTTDVMQHKPGRFVLESCADCGHVFQNPRLNAEGLEFYYRDFYDGLGAEDMNSMLQFNRAGHEGRARMVLAAAGTPPRRWLDVGTGHGHFPQDAKGVLPDTEFDGLDMTEGVVLAQREGRIGRSYRGDFVELAGEIAGRYDVISMYHYLEHTLDPGKEIAAARAALPVGGYLSIELPDPECGWNRLLGRWWTAWLQPQHLNMMPIGNLRARLVELGFDVVEEQRAEPHIATDVVSATLLRVNAATIAGEDLAWRSAPPSRFRKVLRKAAFVASIPLAVAALVVDRVSAPIGRKRGLSNTYRVLARRMS